jgi:hypothetical protein
MVSYPTTFEFVTVTSSSPSLSVESRGLIKKHVMKDIGFARRRFMQGDDCEPQRRRLSPTVNVRRCALSQKASSAELPERQAADKDTKNHETLLRSTGCLSQRDINIGISRLDPFNAFPIESDADVDLLISHSKAKSLVYYLTSLVL